MARSTRRPPVRNTSELHREWLALFDVEGPFLAVPVLKRVWPNGIPDFRTSHPERVEVLSDARRSFETAWEALDRQPGDQRRQDAFRVARDQWVETVLRDVVGWGELLEWGKVPGVQAQSPNRVVTVTAQGALRDADRIGALVHVIDPVDSLRQTPNDLWAATPIDRLEALLRSNEVRIGIVTDGRWWGLVHAADGIMTASGVVDALTWAEEARTRDAFFTLVSRQHIIGGDPAEQIPALFEESVAAAEEITEALGSQVRQAVELLIQSFSESAYEAHSRGRSDPLPDPTHEVYEAAVTMMMRTVFLLFAEERGLLPSGELFEHGYGVSGELDRLTAESAHGEESLDASALTWHRLLATSRAIFFGASFENLRMPAYGGSLFDPSRFGFLSATTEQGTLSIRVSDRVMFHVLRSIQVVIVNGEARRISFRDIDVEQIGYIYEGLLGYTCVRANEPILGLIGKPGSEPEMPLEQLETLAVDNPDSKKLADAIREWLKADQPSADPPSAAALGKALASTVEPTAVSALSQTVDGDRALIQRLTPWLGAIRRDLRGQPFVVRTGGLLVAETPSRRNAGAHYTPKSLAEEVVLHALQPLCYAPGPHQTSDEATWKLRSSDELLGLKVADIACGSGAFLVAAARYLADRVVEAWISEDHLNAERRDLHVRALRQVVANCLYGADINEMAVEMCKLSLWLVSLDRDQPFSFVDDKVFLGNSLLGLTSLDQLRSLHIDPSRVPVGGRLEIFDVDISSILDKAVDLRKRLSSEIDDDDPMRSSAAKRRQLKELQRITADLRRIADGVIAAGLPLGGKPGRALDEAYHDLRLAVKQAYPDGGQAPRSTWLDGLIDRGLTPTVETDYDRWKPLHWVIEAPDVLVERGGFDSILGNPPFLGGKKLSPAYGSDVREWLANVLASGVKGNADLVAFFFLRAADLNADYGTIGLIATNTVAQGDTREVGLDQLMANGLTVTRAIRSQRWPVQSASLEFAAVWGTQGPVESTALRILDGRPARRITSLLEEEGRVSGLPEKIPQNVGIAFIGVNVNGSGFLLSKEEADLMIDADERNARVVRPYIGGEDLNQRPLSDSPRYVIDFVQMPESEARSYGLPFSWLEARAKPYRLGLKNKPKLQIFWWHHESKALGLRDATVGLDELLAIAVVSKTVMPVRVSANNVFALTCCVFATDSFSDQSILSSVAHQLWAIRYASGMKNDPRYTPSDVFETFPRPQGSDWLDRIGRTLDTERREMMLHRELGLTKLYNLVNDPAVTNDADSDVSRLREIHVELDEAVMAAYGWSDVRLRHGFHSYRQMERWTVCPEARAEIFDRLLEENHQRATAKLGDVETKNKSSKSKTLDTQQSLELF